MVKKTLVKAKSKPSTKTSVCVGRFELDGHKRNIHVVDGRLIKIGSERAKPAEAVLGSLPKGIARQIRRTLVESGYRGLVIRQIERSKVNDND